MAIYTKTGDKGETSLFGGTRVSKADIQIEAYGTIDELTSFIGLIASKIKAKDEELFLLDIQKDLYQIMAFLANAPLETIVKNNPIELFSHKVTLFEQKIDLIESKLPKLSRFILPGGTELSSWFHITRSVCRRAERRLVQLQKSNTTLEPKVLAISLTYLNRLSDLFFDMARWYNKRREQLT